MDSDEFTLEIESEPPTVKTQAASNIDTDRRHLASNVSGSAGLISTKQPHAPRLIAEDPEKRRIVGRSSQPDQHKASPAAEAVSETPPSLPAAPAPEPPATPVFEGSGLAEVGTLRKPKRKEDEDGDDEFSYALEGGQREEGFHKQVFRPKAMPAHLVSNVKQRLNTEVLAEEEEEEEEEEGDEDEGDGDAAAEQEQDGEEEEDDKIQHYRTQDKHQGSWTTFAVSEGPGDTLLADGSDPAKTPVEGPQQQQQQPAAAPLRTGSPAEDLPSYKVMQALHVAGSAQTGPSIAGRGPEHASPGPSPATTTAVPSRGEAARKLVEVDKGVGMQPQPQHTSKLQSPTRATEATGAGAAAGLPQPAALGDAGGAAATRTAAAAKIAAETLGVASNIGLQPQKKTPAAAAAATAAAAVEDEWEAANRERQLEQQRTLQPGQADPGPVGGAAAAAVTTLSYHKAVLHFMSMDTSAVRPKVLAALPPQPGFFSRLLCLGPPDLKTPQLRDQLLQLLALARLPFADDDAMHVRLLGALYGTFTGKTWEPPRYGSHWAELGFQGQDPATDLRGCGLLGLLQLYYLTQWSAEAAKQMLRLSQHPVQEFPLAIVSLNVTKWTLQALRNGHLHREANFRSSVVEAAQQFYAGCMATFYTTWLSGSKTMAQSGHVLRELEALALKKAGLMLVAAQRTDLPDPPLVST